MWNKHLRSLFKGYIIQCRLQITLALSRVLYTAATERPIYTSRVILLGANDLLRLLKACFSDLLWTIVFVYKRTKSGWCFCLRQHMVAKIIDWVTQIYLLFPLLIRCLIRKVIFPNGKMGSLTAITQYVWIITKWDEKYIYTQLSHLLTQAISPFYSIYSSIVSSTLNAQFVRSLRNVIFIISGQNISYR